MEVRGESSGCQMNKNGVGMHSPGYMFVHQLISQLSSIVGHCDLLKEDLPKDAKCESHLYAIQNTARSMVEALKKEQSNVVAMREIPPMKRTIHAQRR